MLRKIKNLIKRLILLPKNLYERFLKRFFPVHWKETNELKYWKGVQNKEGVLSNEHYVHFYTGHFGLDSSYYAKKIILDIGCGPRGSLEWAGMASRRIGLDPLANEYLKLGAKQHQMEYIDAPSEKIPLKDGECDAVFSFNSLDHVEDIDLTIKEIKRVTRPSGIFLLLVEVNHPPTDTEPHELKLESLINSLSPEFECETLQVYKPVLYGMYQSIIADVKISDPQNTQEAGYLSAKFKRVASK
jgi:ubiquinone/menaquinone biosynthesis C-methylase UbiE